MAEFTNTLSSVLRNPLDEMFLCDCCATKLAKVARSRHVKQLSMPLIAPALSYPDGCVYFIRAGEGRIKIGMTANAKDRLKALQTANSERLTLLAIVEGGRKLEREYHDRFADHRLTGEWFAPHPDILAEIARLTP